MLVVFFSLPLSFLTSPPMASVLAQGDLFTFSCVCRFLLSSSRWLYICVQSANNVVRVYFRKTKQSGCILFPFTWPIKIFLISDQQIRSPMWLIRKDRVLRRLAPPVINVVLTSCTSVFNNVMVERHWLLFKYESPLLRRSSNAFLPV